MQNQNISYKRYRFPPQIIAHVVLLYICFNLSLRGVEVLLAARGIVVSYEAIRKWVGKFSTKYVASIRRDRSATSDKWHFDEVAIPIRGRKFWLWRATDSNGDVLDILVQSRRNTRAAKHSSFCLPTIKSKPYFALAARNYPPRLIDNLAQMLTAFGPTSHVS